MNGRIQSHACARAVGIAAGQFGVAFGFGVHRDGFAQAITQTYAIDLADGGRLIRIAMARVVLQAFLPVMKAEPAIKREARLKRQGGYAGQAPGGAGARVIGRIAATPVDTAGCVVAELGLRPFYREAVGNFIDEKTKALLKELETYPDVRDEWEKAPIVNSLPVIPIRFTKKGKTLNFFSMVTTVGSPQSITSEELRIECIFPADDESEKNYLQLIADRPRTP